MPECQPFDPCTCAPGQDKEIIFNQASCMSADNRFLWDYTQALLSVDGRIASSGYISTSSQVEASFLATLALGQGALNFTPPAGYGGLVYRGGSIFYFWDNISSTWEEIDFSGGVVGSIINIAHNGTLLGTTGVLDFEDSSTITWQITQNGDISVSVPNTWISNVNANGYGITNLLLINGIPISEFLTNPWNQNVNANGNNLTGLNNLVMTGTMTYQGQSLASYIQSFVSGDLWFLNPDNSIYRNSNVYINGTTNPLIVTSSTQNCYMYLNTTNAASAFAAYAVELGGTYVGELGFSSAGVELWSFSALILKGSPSGTVFLGAPCGINQATPAFPLDVGGSINSSGCFYVGGVQFACSNGAGGVMLNNIVTINGNPPGSGGGGGLPAGANTQIQFNYNGQFGATPNLTWNEGGVGAPSILQITSVGSANNDSAQFRGVSYQSSTTSTILNSGTILSGLAARGTLAAPLYSMAGDCMIGMWAFPYTGGGFTQQAGIGIYALSNHGSANTGTQMQFYNTPLNSTTITLNANLDSTGFNLTLGCYRINGALFACSDGSGGCALDNITTINGAPYVPGGGGGSVNQTPWLSNINAANFNLNSVGSIGIGASALPAQTALYILQNAIGPTALSAVQNNNAGAATISLQNNVGTVCLLTMSGTSASVGAGNMNFNTNAPALTVMFTNAEAYRFNTTGFGVKNSNPQYPLDVNGIVNTNNCYYVNGLPFACYNGAGGVALTNVSTINGALPGAGGGQTPWLSNINGGGYNLSNVDDISLLSMHVTVLGVSHSVAFWLQGSGNGLYTEGGPVGINQLPGAYALSVNGDVNITGQYYVNGTPIALVVAQAVAAELAARGL